MIVICDKAIESLYRRDKAIESKFHYYFYLSLLAADRRTNHLYFILRQHLGTRVGRVPQSYN